jgi:hypothetical protein
MYCIYRREGRPERRTQLLTCAQCVILLLRPLLLRQISSIVSDNESHVEQTEADLQNLNLICFGAARSSLNMLIDLRTCSLLGEFSFPSPKQR